MTTKAVGWDSRGGQHARGDEGIPYLYSRLGPGDLRPTVLCPLTKSKQNKNPQTTSVWIFAINSLASVEFMSWLYTY